mmetsp:Transcript_56273/g.136414  ORF Transcript_56273/g.136414 Transcript_56273/m.136414 type:complete len:207 (-) Transcript_56273:24-644(-)
MVSSCPTEVVTLMTEEMLPPLFVFVSVAVVLRQPSSLQVQLVELSPRLVSQPLLQVVSASRQLQMPLLLLSSSVVPLQPWQQLPQQPSPLFVLFSLPLLTWQDEPVRLSSWIEQLVVVVFQRMMLVRSSSWLALPLLTSQALQDLHRLGLLFVAVPFPLVEVSLVIYPQCFSAVALVACLCCWHHHGDGCRRRSSSWSVVVVVVVL